jgi:hypothetical protein
MKKARKSSPGFRAFKNGPGFFVSTKVKIPRGRILLFNLGEHVAISTGKMMDVPAGNVTMSRYFNKSRIGHGMIELDGSYHDEQVTFREGYIEELATSTGHMSYLMNMVVAPFPICLESGEILLTGDPATDIERHPAVVQGIEKYLDKHADEISAEKNAIYKRRDEKLAKITEQLLETNPDPAPGPASAQQQEYLRLEKELTDIQIQADRELNESINAWTKAAKASKELAEATATARKDIEENGTIYIQYNKNDPYGGAVKF